MDEIFDDLNCLQPINTHGSTRRYTPNGQIIVTPKQNQYRTLDDFCNDNPVEEIQNKKKMYILITL